MALSEKFLNELSEESNYHDFLRIFEDLKLDFKNVLEQVSKKRNNIFDVDDVEIYLQGSYPNNVYVTSGTKLEVIFELKKLKKGSLLEVTKVNKNRDLKVNFDYSLKDFKNDLFFAFLDEFPSQEILKTNRALELVKNRNNPLTVDILPAFSYYTFDEKSKKQKPALIVYEAITNKYVLSYPKLHSLNIEEKDKNTNGAFRKMDRSFRRFTNYLVANEILPVGFAPGYFIDCLLSNVPNNLFKGTLNEMWIKILNFLSLSNLKPFLCVHKQFEMFNNSFDGWTINEATYYIETLSSSYFNIKE